MSSHECLRTVFGYDSFRPGQEELVGGILAGKDVLGIMPTGSGKSVCYQVPALMLSGITLVISPLISLMKDQVIALRQLGISAACINSSLREDEYADAVFGLTEGRVKIVYVAPERLTNAGFVDLCQHLDISLVAVDEAHCVSQWGQDFRPGYLKIADFIRSLPVRPIVSAFTATATDLVRKDILRYLELKEPITVTTGFDRPNLSFSVLEPKDKDQALLSLLLDRPGQSGIIYCSTRKNVEAVCDMLNAEGHAATRYHAGLSPEERTANQDDFLFDRKTLMVATNAFGMGIDKSNVSFVVHYNMPQSLEAYYQEAGRAGRDGCDADCILLYSGQDVITGRWLIEHRDPNPDLSPEQQEQVTEKDLERLKRMTFYAKSKKCFRWNILQYFGEKSPEKCDNCSNCVPECGSVDITVDAQKILSCIVRTGEQYDPETIVSLLIGKLPEHLEGSLDPEKLTTYGIMRDTAIEKIHREIKTLLQKQLLSFAPETSALKLTDLSSGVLFRGRRVTMKLISAVAVPRSSGTVNEALLKDLKYLRLRLASKDQVAAFVIMSDATLHEIAAKLPSNMDELSRISGLGSYKVNRFGVDILNTVRPYIKVPTSKVIYPFRKTTSQRKRFHDEVSSTIKNTKANQGSSWTFMEEEQLSRELDQGMSIREIALIHGRSMTGIQKRIEKLNLDSDYD